MSQADYGKPAISAHRGASPAAPENTLATFRAVLAMQVDYIEIDVRTTRDGKLVVLHDGTLDRTTNGTGPVSNQTLAELKQLSAAKGFDERYQTERIPTLEEVCQLLARWNASHQPKTNLYVDCKQVAPTPLVETLSKFNLLDGAVFYGSDSYLLDLQQQAPTARLMPSLKKADDMAEKINRLHPYAFDVSYPALSKPLVDQIHQQGIKVFSDLLDRYDSSSYYTEAVHLGIDVIQTDQVQKVQQTLQAGKH